jgi:hypothetical protein
MKKIYTLLTFIAFTTTVMAQTKGITYQAVLYDPAYKNQTLPGVDNMLIPYANKSVCLRFQITDKNNQAIYIETQSTKTDPFGMVNLIIGQGNKMGGLVSSFDTINWNTQANSLIVSLDNSGNCSNFNEVTNQPFTASPFALGNTSINTADYELLANKSNNIISDANSTVKYPSVNAIKSYVDSKVVTIQDADATTKGKIQLTGDLSGTAAFPTVPGLALKVDKEPGKGLSSNDYTTAEKTKLGAISGTNTGDQDLTGYATVIALSSKQDVSNISNSIVADASSTTKYPSVKGIKDYVDGLSNTGGVSDGSITSLKIADNAIVNADVSPTAAIDFVKLNISKSNILGLGIVRSDIGLSNVENTSDLSKPISTDTQTALNLKANLASPTFTGNVSGIDKTMVGLGNVDNTSDTAKPISTATQAALDLKANTADISSLLDLKANLASPTFTGTVSGIDKTMVGLGNIDNTSDSAKPISSATQTALDLKANTADVSSSLALKANLASPTFTGTVSGIDKTMVGLGNLDNTSDSAKPISTATQTALDLKANTADLSSSLALKENAANKTIDVSTDGTSDVKFPSAKAVKTYSDAKIVDVITDAITTSAPSQNAVYDALALKADVVDVTSTEITLPTKISGKQLFSKSGTLTIVSGTSATIPAITDLTEYYSIQIFKDGKPFRNEVRLFTVANPIAIVTGNGFMSEIYPSGGTYTYVLEYFK